MGNLHKSLEIIKQKIKHIPFENKYYIDIDSCYVNEYDEIEYNVENSKLFNSKEEAQIFFNKNIGCLCGCDDDVRHYCKDRRRNFCLSCEIGKVEIKQIISDDFEKSSFPLHFFCIKYFHKTSDYDFEFLIGLIIAYLEFYLKVSKKQLEYYDKKYLCECFEFCNLHYNKDFTDYLLEIYKKSDCKEDIIFVWDYFKNEIEEVNDYLNYIYN